MHMRKRNFEKFWQLIGNMYLNFIQMFSLFLVFVIILRKHKNT